MPGNFETSNVKSDFVMQDHSYGKGGVKILHVVKNGIKVKLKSF
jgi:hypothetical protein